MAVLDARDVRAEQASAFLDVTLGQVLRLAKATQTVADEHGLRAPSGETKPLVGEVAGDEECYPAWPGGYRLASNGDVPSAERKTEYMP